MAAAAWRSTSAALLHLNSFVWRNSAAVPAAFPARRRKATARLAGGGGSVACRENGGYSAII